MRTKPLRTLAHVALLAAVILSVLVLSGPALATSSTTGHKKVVASGAGIKWSTPREHGKSIEVTPHPAWPAIEGASWVWRTPTNRNEVVTFTQTFTIPHSARNLTGVLHITSDNAYRVFLNGRLVGANGPFSFDGPDEGTWATIFDHVVNAKKGRNILTVKAINYFGPAEPPDNPAGLIFRLDLNCARPGRG